MSILTRTFTFEVSEVQYFTYSGKSFKYHTIHAESLHPPIIQISETSLTLTTIPISLPSTIPVDTKEMNSDIYTNTFYLFSTYPTEYDANSLQEIGKFMYDQN